MTQISLSYREVIPNFNYIEEWKEVKVNAGGTHSTLQDFKVPEKAGGYCYKNSKSIQCQNRYIYWRSIEDVLKLTEISLDFNLADNNLQLVFSDSPILAVSLEETVNNVILLVATVSSLHRIVLPHPNTLQNSGDAAGGGLNNSSLNMDGQTYSIFHDINSNLKRNPHNFYALDHHTIPNAMPNAASCFLSPKQNFAYYALACQTSLMLYIMNCETGHTVSHQLKESNLMPRLFTNLKGALTGKSDLPDAEFATSLVFINQKENIYLVAIYRSDDLKVWCTKSFSCLGSLCCKLVKTSNVMKGPQNNLLRKINDSNVCVFLSHSNGSEFIWIEIQLDGNNVNLIGRKEIKAPSFDLADYDATEDRIWGLWSNAEGEFSISSYALGTGMGLNWVSAALEPPPDRCCISVEQGMDPKEAYCSYIFHPGKFDQNTISKALIMFRRTNVRGDTNNTNLSLLKDHVCLAIEEETQNELKDYDISDEDFLEISTRLWEKFYTCCEQYHMKASQPTGLFVLKSLDGVCIIKKTLSSLLRPCESLEHLMLTGDDIDIEVVVPIQFPNNQSVGTQMVHLVGILAQIEKWLPDDVKIDLDKKLNQLERPEVLITKLSTEIMSGDPDREILPKNFMVYLRQKLQSIKDIRHPIGLLLQTLRMDNGNPEAMRTHISMAQLSRLMLSNGSMFGSNVGLSLLSETVRQTSMIRFAICRNLLIFLQLLIDVFILPHAILEDVRKTLYPETAKFLQAYYVMVWIAEKPINLAQTSSNDATRQRLFRFQLLDSSERYTPTLSKVQIIPLLNLFLRAKGIYVALFLCAEHLKTIKDYTWQTTLFPLNTIISQLIWPISCNFVFGEWIFSTCQHTIIEDYVRLLNSWCDWNIGSRSFILAVNLLDCSETTKALDIFMTCTEQIFKETFLRERILYTSPLSNEFQNINYESLSEQEKDIYINKGIAQYFLKLIQLFENHNALDHVVTLAKEATGILEKDDPQIPMFQSIVFNNQLILEHYEEAYNSMTSNVDESRKKNCLRQLIVTLFQKRRMLLLMNFPYTGMEDEFQNIVECRARSLAIEQNSIYDFLYAYYISNNNTRKASTIMYEKAMRLQLETNSVESMDERLQALLISINALYLCDPRYRWIAKPITYDDYNGNNSFNRIDPDETLNPDNVDILMNEETLKKQIEVIKIKDIKKEFLITEAISTLSKHKNEVQCHLKTEPRDISFILSSQGLFTAAFKLSKGCEITLIPIFEHLTSACLRCVNENPTQILEWISANDLADLPPRAKAADLAWSFLQYSVEEHEESDSIEVRKAVINTILASNGFVPQWLFNSLKQDNCAELLNLFVTHNRLLEATDLACEMIKAMLGTGSQYFSFKHSFAVSNPVLAIPIHVLDVLLRLLKLNASEDIDYKKAIADLEELLEKYVKTALRTADDKRSVAAQKYFN